MTARWIERAVRAGLLSPAARTMSEADIVSQLAGANALSEFEAREELRAPATITGPITWVQRHGTTVYGNPIMSVCIKTEEVNPAAGYAILRISDNAALVYEVENPEFKAEPHTFALTRAGRISHVVKGA